jgi:hypothetical protein
LELTFSDPFILPDIDAPPDIQAASVIQPPHNIQAPDETFLINSLNEPIVDSPEENIINVYVTGTSIHLSSRLILFSFFPLCV